MYARTNAVRVANLERTQTEAQQAGRSFDVEFLDRAIKTLDKGTEPEVPAPGNVLGKIERFKRPAAREEAKAAERKHGGREQLVEDEEGLKFERRLKEAAKENWYKGEYMLGWSGGEEI